MKKSKKTNSPKKLLQQKYKRVLIILIAIFVIISLPLVIAGWAIGSFNFSYYKAEKNNPAKKLAEIMIPFAKEYNLEKIEENNNPVFFSNSEPSFTYTYQGNQSMDEMKDLTVSYLEKNGYSITIEVEKDICDPKNNIVHSGLCQGEGKAFNDGYPHYQLGGINRAGDKVSATIYDRDKNLPPGKIKLYINFSPKK